MAQGALGEFPKVVNPLPLKVKAFRQWWFNFVGSIS
jgi:hypothetical protein